MATNVFKQINLDLLTPTTVGDDLGNHTATQDFHLDGNAVRTDEADGASAIGFQFQTDNALVTDGSILLQLNNMSDLFLQARRGSSDATSYWSADDNIIELASKTGTIQGFIIPTDDQGLIIGNIADLNLTFANASADQSYYGAFTSQPFVSQLDITANKSGVSAGMHVDVSGTYGQVSLTGDQLQVGFNIVTLQPTGTTADKDRLQDLVSAVHSSGGGIIQLSQGLYDLDDGVVFSSINNVTIRGAGRATRLTATGGGTGAMIEFAGTSDLVDQPLNNFSRGATSVFTTTAAAAGQVGTGDTLFIVGTDSVTGYKEGFTARASANGNGGTGEITLVNPAPMGFTGGLLDNPSANKFNRLENLQLEPAGTYEQIILARYSDHLEIRDLNIEGEDVALTGTATDGISMVATFDTLIERVTISNLDGCRAIACRAAMTPIVRGCKIYSNNNSSTGTTPQAAILLGVNAYGGLVEGNFIQGGKGDGAIVLDAGAHNVTRTRVRDNEILYRPTGQGIQVNGGYQNSVEGNDIRSCISGSSGFGILANMKDGSACDNTIVDCSWGIVSNISGGNNVRINDNTLERIDQQGIYLNNGADSAICGNDIRTVNNSDAIGIDNSQRVSCVGNTVNFAPRGIRVYDDSDDVTVNGNTVFDTTSGIWVDGSATVPTNVVIVGNLVRTATTGIRLSACQDCAVTSNRVDNATTGIKLEDNTGVCDNNLVDHNNIRSNITPLSDTSTGVNNQKLSNLVA